MDMEHGHMAVEVPHHEELTQQFHTAHFSHSMCGGGRGSIVARARGQGIPTNAIGPVAYLCRPQCSIMPLGVRRPRGFCLPMLSADGAGYRSR